MRTTEEIISDLVTEAVGGLTKEDFAFSVEEVGAWWDVYNTTMHDLPIRVVFCVYGPKDAVTGVLCPRAATEEEIRKVLKHAYPSGLPS